jgi:hypothetical protein
MNGIHLDSSDYTATDGLRVTMTSPVAVGTEIYVVAYAKFAVDDHYTKSEVDGKDATNAFQYQQTLQRLVIFLLLQLLRYQIKLIPLQVI